MVEVGLVPDRLGEDLVRVRVRVRGRVRVRVRVRVRFRVRVRVRVRVGVRVGQCTAHWGGGMAWAAKKWVRKRNG